MLRFVLCVSLCPALAWADDVMLDSRVASVTLYPDGAEVVREAAFTLPPGTHRLIAPDVPLSALTETLRLAAPGVRLGAMTVRQVATPPRDVPQSPALITAEEAVERLEQSLREAEDEVAAIGLRAQAAQLQLDYLGRLAEEQPTADSAAALAEAIGTVGLQALEAAQEARIDAREANIDLADLREDLADALRARDALLTDEEERMRVTIEVTAEAVATGTLTLRYLTDAASWAPVYDVRLTQGDTPDLTLTRGAYIAQDTGEGWSDVALRLSTLQPSDQTEPSQLWPQIRRIADPAPAPAPFAVRSKSMGAEVALMDSAAVEPAIIAEEAGVRFDGVAVSYAYGQPLSLASGADAVRIALGSLSVTPEVFARATPRRDDTAYLVAAFTNDTGEPILPSDYEATLFVDGEVVGLTYLDQIAAGDTAELSFGAIEALRLTRVTEDRNAGDRGVLGRTNAQTEAARIEVVNLGDQTWPVRLRDQVPVSQQEDLSITWSATPRPTTEDVMDKPGILEWHFDSAPGDTTQIRLSHELRWPADKVLR